MTVIAGQQIISADCSVISASWWIKDISSRIGQCSWRSRGTSRSLGSLPESGTVWLLTDL